MNVLTALPARTVRARSAWRWLLIAILLIGVAAFSSKKQANAQVSAIYSVVWASVSASTLAQAGAYQLNVTVGQPEVGLQRGGDYDLGGGFWGSTTPAPTDPLEEGQLLYLPMIGK